MKIIEKCDGGKATVKGCKGANGERLLRCINCTFQDDASKCYDFRNLEGMQIVDFVVEILRLNRIGSYK